MNKLSDAVLAALIAGVCAVIGQLLISLTQSAKHRTDDAVRDAKLEEKLKSMEKKLDEHNGYAQLFSSVQTDIAIIKTEIKTLFKEKEK